MNYQNAEFHNVEELIEDQEHGGFRILRIPQPVLEKLNPIVQRTACDFYKKSAAGGYEDHLYNGWCKVPIAKFFNIPPSS